MRHFNGALVMHVITVPCRDYSQTDKAKKLGASKMVLDMFYLAILVSASEGLWGGGY